MKYEKNKSNVAIEDTEIEEVPKSPSGGNHNEVVADNFLKLTPQILRSASVLKNKRSPELQKNKRKVKVKKPSSPVKKRESVKPTKKVLVARKVKENEQNDITQISTAETQKSIDGMIKTYQILGTVEDFLLEASKDSFLIEGENDDLNNNNLQEIQRESISADPPSTAEKRKDETKALNNWSTKLEDRKKLQKYLARKMNVNEDMLLLNQSEKFREIQEERMIIDRAMPSKNYGKGYRVGSEFWKQAEEVGDSISITLNQTEKGKVPPIEHIGTPAHVKKINGYPWSVTSRMLSVHYPWSHSPYLEERKAELSDIIQELDPFLPDFDGLEVVGRKIDYPIENKTGSEVVTEDNSLVIESQVDDDEETNRDPLDRFKDVIPEPIFGPSLIVNGEVVNWQGSFDPAHQDIVGCILRLFFEASIEQCVESKLVLTNNGTTTLYYQWRKDEEKDYFGLISSNKQKRFYFNMCGGCILPGDTATIPFFFKSNQAGMFKEAYVLDTRPVLMAGKKIQIVLKGRASSEDQNQKEREKIEDYLSTKQKETMIGRIVDEILNGVVTPPRPGTPASHYTTEEELFKVANSDLNNTKFYSDVVSRLKDLYNDAVGEESTDNPGWDLRLETLKKNILSCTEDDDREKYLLQLNSNMLNLIENKFHPVEETHYDACYQIICDTIDKIVNKASLLRQTFGLPEKEFVLKQEISVKKPKKQLVADVQTTNRSRADSRGKKERSGSPTRKTPKSRDKGETVLSKPDSSDVIQAPNISEESQNLLNTTQNPAYCSYIGLFKTQVYNSLCDMAISIETVLDQ